MIAQRTTSARAPRRPGSTPGGGRALWYAPLSVAADDLEGERAERGPIGPVTVLLQRATEGEPGALERLLEVVYGELRALAQSHMRAERAGHTLQPTALVHEAYLRLLRLEQVPWQGRGHFFRAAAESMRRILIDHARARMTQKRGEGRAALEIANVEGALAQEDGSGLLDLDQAIERLGRAHPEAAEIVRLKFYAGLDSAAAADVLGISERSVRREWAFARGWLRDRLERDARGEP